ncbi:MAG: pilin [Patescibacteria group bacterium]|nr:pilin [Patescibacteria group bacterium]
MLKFGKYILFLAVIIGLGFAVNAWSASSYGLNTAAQVSGLSSNAISRTGDIPRVIGQIVSVALSLVGVYFFVLILIAGLTWMTAAGSTEKVTQAKNKMQSAFIGLIIVLAAYAIAGFIFESFLSVSSGGCASGTAAPGSRSADCVKDGKVCGASKGCVEECKYIYPDAKCMDLESGQCDGKILSGLCPGGANMKCCVSDAEYSAVNSSPDSGSGGSGGTNEPPAENACVKSGGFCSTVAGCTNQNGKAGQVGGCAKGEVCCKSCQQAGGVCIQVTNTQESQRCEPETKLKSGYCFGAFAAEDFKCCFGEVKEYWEK